MEDQIMKKHKLFITCFFFPIYIGISSFALFSQWEFQNPVFTNEYLSDIQFIDTNHGWVVGQFGTILHSPDGGVTWEEQQSNTGSMDGYYNYQSVYFTDIMNGWVAGRYSLEGGGYSSCLMHTADGGSLWELQYGNTDEEFLDVCFTDPLNGWLVGAMNEWSGFVRHTSDGGNNWVEQYTEEGGYFRSLCFLDQNIGWAVGDNGIILHTSNGGETWEDQFSGIYTSFTSVCITDLNNGWVVGINSNPSNQKIYHTTDGGSTWNDINLFGNYFSNIFFTDLNHGWVGCYPHSEMGNIVWYTTDGGTNWNYYHLNQIIDSPLTLFFTDPNTGWALAENVILFSFNGGIDWEIQNSVSNANFKSVFFADQDNGWAFGERFHHTGEWNADVIILHTNNGGKDWQIEGGGYFNWGDIFCNKLFFVDQYHGWASGSGILKTTDGGLNWSSVSGIVLNPIFFIDTLNGWGGGGNRDPGDWSSIPGVFHTMDGGENWTQQCHTGEDSYISSLIFLNQNEGWAVGCDTASKGLILRTTDGGITWDKQLSGIYAPLNSVSFINQASGWAVGDSGTILHTTDGGNNWALQVCPAEFSLFSLKSVSFPDGERGWITGILNDNQWWGDSYGSVLLNTTNGGETWQEQFYRPYSGLTSIQFTDSERGWAVGYGGTILHTNNGGTAEVPKIKIPNSILQLKNFPNPFNSSTTIQFTLPNAGHVNFEIHDITGRKIKTLHSGYLHTGEQSFIWDARFARRAEGFKGGLYLLRLETDGISETRKLLLIK